MKERELVFADAHSCSWYVCRGGTHAVEQLRQRTEVVGSAPLAVGCGDDAGALRCVSTPAPCQFSTGMCIRGCHFLFTERTDSLSPSSNLNKLRTAG